MVRTSYGLLILLMASGLAFPQSGVGSLDFVAPPPAQATASVLWAPIAVRLDDIALVGGEIPISVNFSAATGTLQGTLTRVSQGGVATFDDLWFNAVGPVEVTFQGPGVAPLGPVTVKHVATLEVGAGTRFPTITQAMAAVMYSSITASLELLLHPGVYAESVEVFTAVRGLDRETSVVNGNLDVWGKLVSNLSVNGRITFRNSPGTLRDATVRFGGVTFDAEGLVERCAILDSTVAGVFGQGLSYYPTITVRDTDLLSNRSGVLTYDSIPKLTRCRIEDSIEDGVLDSGLFLTIRDCLIADNGGDGLRGSSQCISSTFVGNGGAGIRGGATLQNSIVRNNGAGSFVGEFGGTLTATHSNVEGGPPGAGNIDVDPLFVDPVHGDYRLLAGSPCIDAATVTSDAPWLDLDGHARHMGPYPDMGPFEFGVPPWLVVDCPLGPGSVRVQLLDGPPGFAYFTTFTLDPQNANGGLGSGPWAGLHISNAELALWAGVTTPPVFGVLDAQGNATWEIPGGLIPAYAMGTHYAVTRTFDPVAGTPGPASDPIAFERIAGPVVVSSVSPASGPATGGTPVTIHGSGFGPQSTVTFGRWESIPFPPYGFVMSAAATNVAVVNSTTITCATPPAPDHYTGTPQPGLAGACGVHVGGVTGTFAFTYE